MNDEKLISKNENVVQSEKRNDEIEMKLCVPI